MRWLLIIGFVAACGDDGGSTGDGGTGDSGGPDAPAVDPLVGVGGVEVVDMGYLFLEGPQWRESEGVLLFTDIPASTIYKYTPGGGPATIFRTPSGESNGLAIDQAGSVISAQHNNHMIARDGVEIVSIFENNRLNSPNDVTVDNDGTIYFTDPPYGLPTMVTGQPFMGVFRIDPTNTVTAEHRGAMTERPNGVGLSPDSKRLYVADTADGKLWAFPIMPGGALGARTMFAMTSGNPDGLAIDAAGNIFVATTGGIDVFAPNGSKWGAIPVPQMQPSNCAFGDADHKTLYITARTALYKVRLANAGEPRR